ncbi:hypothetical protein F5Y05DRAFT_381115 [Hypoxylon sp. FL0543]|nr:hypothetical protein F5Y05DRAFT_381115 [Hypoxylon sp. FL0543]
MENSRHEDTPGFDQISAAVSRLVSIQQNYAKERQETESAQQQRDSTLANRQNALRSNIQRLQKELEDKLDEEKRIGSERKKMQDEYRAREKAQRQMYNKEVKKEMENWIKMSSVRSLSPSRERDEQEQHTTRRGEPEPSDDPYQIEISGAQTEDEIIVEDSEPEDSSTEEMINRKQPGARADISEGNIQSPESSISTTTRGQEQQRLPKRPMRRAERLENEDHSDAPPSKMPRRGSQKKSRGKAITPSRPGSSKKSAKPIFEGITSPNVGCIYKVVKRSGQKAGYAAVIVPTGDFGEIAISRSIRNTGLLKSVPACYRYNKEAQEILGWKDDYDDGGSKVTRREFPVMYFDQGLYIPLVGEFAPYNAKFEWVAASDLRPYKVTPAFSAAGQKEAQRFTERLRLFRERQIEDQRIRSDDGSPGVSDTAAAANVVVQKPARAASSTTIAGELPRQPSVRDESDETPGRPLSRRSGPQQSPRQTAESSWNIRTFRSINQETAGFDPTMDIQDSPDPLGAPEFPTSHSTHCSDGVRGGAVYETVYGSENQNGIDQRRFEPGLSTSTSAIHTNLNGGDSDNSAESAASSATTHTLTGEPRPSIRTGPETPKDTAANDERNIAPGWDTRDTAFSALSFLNDHYQIHS